MNQFSKWLSENKSHLPNLTINLFEDSLKCFFNYIERPAFLLAYQGVMAYIREVLLKSAPPAGWTEGEWQNTLRNTQKDDAWDAEVLNLIKNRGSAVKEAPLKLSDPLRNQFEYWRTQRNICAHYKKDTFLRAHVEAFYGFITDWLLKISVGGGLATMLTKVTIYCDPSQTPFNESFDPIVDMIPQFVQETEYEDFIKNSIRTFARSHRRNPKDFMESILARNDGKFAVLHERMIEIIRVNDNCKYHLLGSSPNYVLEIVQSPGEIRKFWHDDIDNLHTNKLGVFAILLEANKIPDDQKNEAIEKILKSLKDEDRGLYDSDSATLEVLRKHGYFKQFVETYIIPEEMNSSYASDLKMWCYQSNFFIDHLNHAEMDADLVVRLIDCFSNGKPHPYTIYDRLKKELWEDNQNDFRSRFEKVVAENNIALPSDWLQ